MSAVVGTPSLHTDVEAPGKSGGGWPGKNKKDFIGRLLKDSITMLLRNGLDCEAEFCVEALIGVTLDQKNVMLFSINETVNLPDDCKQEKKNEQPQQQRQTALSLTVMQQVPNPPASSVIAPIVISQPNDSRKGSDSIKLPTSMPSTMVVSSSGTVLSTNNPRKSKTWATLKTLDDDAKQVSSGPGPSKRPNNGPSPSKYLNIAPKPTPVRTAGAFGNLMIRSPVPYVGNLVQGPLSVGSPNTSIRGPIMPSPSAIMTTSGGGQSRSIILPQPTFTMALPQGRPLAPSVQRPCQAVLVQPTSMRPRLAEAPLQKSPGGGGRKRGRPAKRGGGAGGRGRGRPRKEDVSAPWMLPKERRRSSKRNLPRLEPRSNDPTTDQFEDQEYSLHFGIQIKNEPEALLHWGEGHQPQEEENREHDEGLSRSATKSEPAEAADNVASLQQMDASNAEVFFYRTMATEEEDEPFDEEEDEDEEEAIGETAGNDPDYRP